LPRKPTKPISKRIFWISVSIFPFLLLVQFLYYTLEYITPFDVIPEEKLVLVYSGGENRVTGALQVFGDRGLPQFLFSGWDYAKPYLLKATGLNEDRILLEGHAMTTDQNARYSKPLIITTGAKHVVLALPWYHMPRALFLTRFYLLGTGIKVVPYAPFPTPERWWTRREFRLEFVKFWGSLGRIVLAIFGIENWPKPSWLNTLQ